MRLKRLLAQTDGPAMQRLCTRAPTLEQLLTSDLELLARECGIAHAELKQLAMDLALASVQPRSAREWYDEALAQNVLVPTGVVAFDQVLKGGLSAGEICEVVGAPGSGKSSLCIAVCAAQATASGSVLYFDTANGELPRTLRAVATAVPPPR